SHSASNLLCFLWHNLFAVEIIYHVNIIFSVSLSKYLKKTLFVHAEDYNLHPLFSQVLQVIRGNKDQLFVVLGHLMFHYIITKFSINCCIFTTVNRQSKILHNIECDYIQHLFFLSIHSIRVKKCTSVSSAFAEKHITNKTRVGS
ncbi:hypothetical protein ACJX0J_023446, partial [Zea mays]